MFHVATLEMRRHVGWRINQISCTKQAAQVDKHWWSHSMKHVVSYELLLSLFVYSGLYKGYPVLANLPVDLTLALGVSCVVSACLMLFLRRVRITRIQVVITGVALLFFIWMAFSSIWGTDSYVAMHKATVMLPTVMIGFLGSVLVVSSSETRCRRLINCIVMLAIAQSVTVVTEYVTQRPVSSLYVQSGDYLGSGQLIGMAWTEEIGELRQEIQATRDAVAATQETVEEIGEWIRAKPEEKRPWWARLLKR